MTEYAQRTLFEDNDSVLIGSMNSYLV